MSRRSHWEQVYLTKSPDDVSWYQSRPTLSLDLIEATGAEHHSPIIDIGGGASSLVDELLARGYDNLAVLDVAEPAVAIVKERLGDSAATVEWYVTDITGFVPPHRWTVWHDRAVFHFLVDETDRAAYLAALEQGVEPGGHTIIATFGPSGPPRCSGLPVHRYSPTELSAVLGDGWELVSATSEDHETPFGTVQAFVYCHFRRI